jgi:hypothetical protein
MIKCISLWFTLVGRGQLDGLQLGISKLLAGAEEGFQKAALEKNGMPSDGPQYGIMSFNPVQLNTCSGSWTG